MRLNKYISQSGYCSRRKADELIVQGKVLVNSRPVKVLGTKIDPEIDDVRIKNGPSLKPSKQKVLLMLYKPKGYVCTKSDQHANRTVYDLLPEPYNRFISIGRLDKDSEGLLLFTNDGDLANELAHPRHNKEKKYLVTVRGLLSDKELGRIEKGMKLYEYRTAPAKVKMLGYDQEKDRSQVEIILTEGKKRQIRNMFLALNHPVKALLRFEFGKYKLGGLNVGEWKLLAIRK